ncbi:DUF2953 domain-containing protein [Anoxybacteroides amylolyticum]|uniref:DUF2953 domain-containing protein n=1 Tax=Anoxybacteroides amylolyticum TaxID=294699 RepID=UPI001EE72CBE|nr:DUF2953 domain-containing protein [Anoxybacillus amylolyticus]
MIVAIILILLVVFLCMKLSISLFFQHAQDDDECRITFSMLFGLIRYTVRIPLIKVDKESPGIVVAHKQTVQNVSESEPKRSKYNPREIVHSFKEAKDFVHHVVHLHVIARKFFSHVSVTKMEWQSKIGTGDAAKTGLVVGMGWSLKYGVVAIISKYMRLKTKPLLSITPSFQQAVSETKFVCMIHFRIGHAIVAAIRIIKYWRGNRWKKETFNHQANESY